MKRISFLHLDRLDYNHSQQLWYNEARAVVQWYRDYLMLTSFEAVPEVASCEMVLDKHGRIRYARTEYGRLIREARKLLMRIEKQRWFYDIYRDADNQYNPFIRRGGDLISNWSSDSVKWSYNRRAGMPDFMPLY